MPDPARSPVLELDDVTKSYSTGAVMVEALRGVTLVVREQEFVAITGESGSGKTTLLGILGCLDRPTSGSYRLVGQEVAELPEAERAKVRAARIGFIFQAYNLLTRATAYANVELPLIYAKVPSRERRERVLTALASVGLGDRVNHHPNQLSGGQQQRVAIARALVNEPSIILADEPTGNLDSASAEEVLVLLEDVNARGTTIALVTHSERVSERASRILHVADGEVAG
ncbi:MAG: ABC transporter ATP-binding protein [Acidimicrobiales bacterium]